MESSERAPRGPGAMPGFLALAWPSLVENVLLTIMGMISMMMVGRLGPSAMAGVGAANQVLNLSIVVFNGLAVGTTALVARRVGSGERSSAQKVIAQSLGIGGLASLGIAAVGFIVAEPVLRVMGTAPEVAADGAIYLRGVMAATPLMVVTLIVNGGLRGSGDTRTPMVVTAAANIANVVVAYPLIFGLAGLPALGIAGAAWGIIVARLVGFLMVGRKLLDGQSGSVIELLRSMRFERQVLGPLMKISLPSAAESGMVQVGMMIFSLITISLGTEAFAAQQIVFTIANLSMMPGVAFSTAATTLVGQALGAKDPALAEASGWRGARSAAIWMSMMGAVFFLFPDFFARMYTDDQEVIRRTVTGLMVIGCGQPLQGLAFVLSGALRGAGDTKTTMQRGTFSMWVVRLPIAYVCGVVLGLGVFGVWLGWLGDWALRSVFFVTAFRAGKWKKIRV